MADARETRYARSGNVHIAYEVVGDGPVDLVYVPGYLSHVEAVWDSPMGPFVDRLARFCRLIIFDRRGVGMSDRVPRIATLEERMDDIRAVMDAAGSSRAVIFGQSESGPMCCLFAATYPERTDRLVLYGSYARTTSTDDYPIGLVEELVEAAVEQMAERWGDGIEVDLFAPSMAEDQAFRRAWARFGRLSTTPGGFRDLMATTLATDVRDVLPSIRVPTLVVHRTGDRAVFVEQGRHLAEQIPGARMVELPGVDHFVFVGDSEAVAAEIEEFATGSRPSPETDRVLSTVLFTDVVESTERSARLGDRRWRELLDAHDRVVERSLGRFGGRLVKLTGDGSLATFDGPARAIRAADAIRAGVRELGLEVRAGLHTGEVELRGEDVGGIAVHIAARVSGVAPPGQVVVSRTVTDLVAGSGIEFEDLGEHTLKGVPGAWRLFSVVAA